MRTTVLCRWKIGTRPIWQRRRKGVCGDLAFCGDFLKIFLGDFQDLSNNDHNNTPRVWTAHRYGRGRKVLYLFFKYLIRLVEDNVKRPPPLRRRRRFIICRGKRIFFITPRPLVCTVSIWCKFPMWIAWHARYNGLNDSGDIERRRYSIFFFFYTFVTLQNVKETRVYI